VERLLTDGWNLYEENNYEGAKAKFDSVIEIDASVVDAYLGSGWCNMHTSDFAVAHTRFSIAIALEGTRPAIDLYGVDVDSIVPTGRVDTVISGGYHYECPYFFVYPELVPVMGVSNTVFQSKYFVRVDSTRRDTVWISPDTAIIEVVYDTLYKDVEYTVNDFTQDGPHLIGPFHPS
jgi:hypothetical protein